MKTVRNTDQGGIWVRDSMDSSPRMIPGLHGFKWDGRCEHCRDGAHLPDRVEPHSESVHMQEIR